jgi:hypothetical protein
LQDKTNKEDAMKMQAAEAKFREHEEPKKREGLHSFPCLFHLVHKKSTLLLKFLKTFLITFFRFTRNRGWFLMRGEEDDVAPPIVDSSCYIVLDYVVATVTASVGPGVEFSS